MRRPSPLLHAGDISRSLSTRVAPPHQLNVDGDDNGDEAEEEKEDVRDDDTNYCAESGDRQSTERSRQTESTGDRQSLADRVDWTVE